MYRDEQFARVVCFCHTTPAGMFQIYREGSGWRAKFRDEPVGGVLRMPQQVLDELWGCHVRGIPCSDAVLSGLPFDLAFWQRRLYPASD